MIENELIAEFMGIESDNAKMRGELYECPVTAEYVSHLEYQTSWDWLIPVVSKCFKTGDDTHQWDDIKDAMFTDNIDIVYNQVVEFIKEYNKIGEMK